MTNPSAAHILLRTFTGLINGFYIGLWCFATLFGGILPPITALVAGLWILAIPLGILALGGLGYAIFHLYDYLRHLHKHDKLHLKLNHLNQKRIALHQKYPNFDFSRLTKIHNPTLPEHISAATSQINKKPLAELAEHIGQGIHQLFSSAYFSARLLLGVVLLSGITVTCFLGSGPLGMLLASGVLLGVATTSFLDYYYQFKQKQRKHDLRDDCRYADTLLRRDQFAAFLSEKTTLEPKVIRELVKEDEAYFQLPPPEQQAPWEYCKRPKNLLRYALNMGAGILYAGYFTFALVTIFNVFFPPMIGITAVVVPVTLFCCTAMSFASLAAIHEYKKQSELFHTKTLHEYYRSLQAALAREFLDSGRTDGLISSAGKHTHEPVLSTFGDRFFYYGKKIWGLANTVVDGGKTVLFTLGHFGRLLIGMLGISGITATVLIASSAVSLGAILGAAVAIITVATIGYTLQRRRKTYQRQLREEINNTIKETQESLTSEAFLKVRNIPRKSRTPPHCLSNFPSPAVNHRRRENAPGFWHNSKQCTLRRRQPRPPQEQNFRPVSTRG